MWVAKTAARRVRPPSTASMYTTSARSMLRCGRPGAVSSILTAITGFAGTPPTPVSGFFGAGFGLGFGVGVAELDDGVGVGVGGVAAAACFLCSDVHAVPAKSTLATAATA